MQSTLSKLEASMSDVSFKLQPVLWKPVVWFLFLTFANLLYKCYGSSLRRVPGPFLARFSNFWKLSAAWNQDMPKRNIEAHQKYGPVVRIGHDTVSVSDPSALATVYSFQAWEKVRRTPGQHCAHSITMINILVGFLSHCRGIIQGKTSSEHVSGP